VPGSMDPPCRCRQPQRHRRSNCAARTPRTGTLFPATAPEPDQTTRSRRSGFGPGNTVLFCILLSILHESKKSPYPISQFCLILSLVRPVTELERECAIDDTLEADSMHGYREKVWLLQFSIPSRTVMVDPLAIGDLAFLRLVMANPDCAQDLARGRL
jgi:hypothetical protein